MRKLHRDHAALLEQDFMPADEVVDVRHVRKHVVAEQQVRLAELGGYLRSPSRAEELHGRRNAFRDRASATFAAGSMPRHGDAAGDESAAAE